MGRGPRSTSGRTLAAIFASILILTSVFGIGVLGIESNAHGISSEPRAASALPPPSAGVVGPMAAYDLTLLESGLPNGTSWEANCNGTWASTSTANITFTVGNGSYDCGVYMLNSQTYLTYTPQIPVNVSGASKTVNVSFELSYPAWFDAVGLPNNLSYGLDVTITAGPLWVGDGFGGSSHNWSYPMLNGTYNFTASCGYSCTDYLASPANGSYTISGAPAYSQIQFVPNTSALPTFTETGLGGGATWDVNLTNGTGATWTLGPAITLANQSIQRLSGLVPEGNYIYTVSGPSTYSVSPATGYLSLPGGATPYLCIEFTSPSDPIGSPCGGYGITFNAFGLPNSSPFCANTSDGDWGCLGGGGPSPKTVFLGGFFDGTYQFTIPAQGTYVATPSSGTIVIHHANVTVNVTFGTGPFFQVTFVESGLPNGTTWAVTVNGITNTSNSSRNTVAGLPNGTYSFSIPDAGGYQANPSSSGFTVFGVNQTVPVSFGYAAPPLYPVMFHESGLPAGGNWSVTIGNLTESGRTSSLQFNLTIGTYLYSARSPSSHNCTCAGYLSVWGPTSLPIQFFPDSYVLSFRETGLPSGMGWAVLIGTRSNSSLTSSIEFVVNNGTFGYVLLPPSGFTATPSSGSVTVNGANVSVGVAMHPVLYPIVFIVLGLSNGTNWSVHVANVSLGINETVNGTSNAITIFLPNGTYVVTFGLPPGYSFPPGSTEITVAGKPIWSVPVQTSSSVNGKGDARDIPPWQEIVLAAGLFAVALGLLGFYVGSRRKRSRP